jgi:hypothetical protein
LNAACASPSCVAGPLKRISTSLTRVRGPGSTLTLTRQGDWASSMLISTRAEK